MELPKNVFASPELWQRIEDGTLSPPEKGRVALADFAAAQFPQATVYLEKEPQGVALPAVFLGYFEQVKRRKLSATARYELSFEITYLPADPLSKTEADHALWLLQQNITDIPGYAVQQVRTGRVDGGVQLTGTLVFWEKNEDTGPVIEIAHQEVQNKPCIIEETESEVKS